MLIQDARPPLLGFGFWTAANACTPVATMRRMSWDLCARMAWRRPVWNGAAVTWLDGASGFALAEVDDHKREIPDTMQKMVPSRDGYDVHTTLDANIQHIVTEEAEKIVAQFASAAAFP